MIKINNYISEKLHISKDIHLDDEISDKIFKMFRLRDLMARHSEIKKKLENWVKENNVTNISVITNFKNDNFYINKNYANEYLYDPKYFDILEAELFDTQDFKSYTVSISRTIYFTDSIIEYFIDQQHAIIVTKYERNK